MPTDPAVRRALEQAEAHLEAAENVLWETAARAESDDAERLEALTGSIWALQHELMDAQGAVEPADADREPIFAE